MILQEKIKQKIIQDFSNSHSYPKKDIVDELITDSPFDFSRGWKDRFFEAMRFSFAHHSKDSEFYKRLCQKKGFALKDLKSFEDIFNIPFILSDAFKHYSITTKTGDLVKTEITSSGTSGRKSTVALNILSGQRLLASSYYIYKALSLAAPETVTNYILMAYNPALDATRATTNSDILISQLTPRKEVFYALDAGDGGEVEFLKDKAVKKLRSFIKDGLPIRTLGFLHHICEMVKEYEALHGKVVFPKDSYILSGGGWKNFAHLYGSAFNLLDFLAQKTTIDLKNVRDLYTLNEHPIFYAECEEHNMHVPNVALACIRDPRTLEQLPYGKTGLIHLYSPLIESSPILSILTTDYGWLGQRCSCHRGGPYLKIIGRAGVTKKATCTLTADQYIK